MVKADFNGQTDKFMMGNGKTILNMEVVFGKTVIQLLLILVNGAMELSQGLGF